MTGCKAKPEMTTARLMQSAQKYNPRNLAFGMEIIRDSRERNGVKCVKVDIHSSRRRAVLSMYIAQLSMPQSLKTFVPGDILFSGLSVRE